MSISNQGAEAANELAAAVEGLEVKEEVKEEIKEDDIVAKK